MKIKNLNDVNKFKAAINKCKGQVWLESRFGDSYNLKSELSQYIAMADLIRDKGEELELFAQFKEDEVILINFLIELEKDHNECLENNSK